MYKGKSVAFPAVGFPKDFKEQIMKGKRLYDFDFLMTRGFAVIYTVIGNEEGFEEVLGNIKKTVEANSVKTYFLDDMNKPPKEYFNDILFNWYDIIRGTAVLGDFPLGILFFVTHMSHFFGKDETPPTIHLGTYEKITSKGKCYFIILSNRKEFALGNLANAILNGHEDNIRKLVKEHEKSNKSVIKNNTGIVIMGEKISIQNSQIINKSYFAPIYDEINKRKSKSEKDIIKAVKEIEKKGKTKKYWSFLKNNAPWIIPMLEMALKLSGKN